MPPTMAARWITCEQPRIASRACSTSRRSPRVDLAALAHPVRRRPLVGDADLEVRVAQQAPHDRRADRPGAARDEDAAHVAQRRDFVGVGEDLRRAERVPRIDDEAVGSARSAISGQRLLGRRERAVVRRDDHDVGAADRVLEARRRRGDDRVVHGDVRELALEQPHELVRERVALVVGVALEGQAEHGDLALAQVAEPALDAVDEEQRHALVHARDAEQHARGVRLLLREREVLAQAGAGGEAGQRHAAARVVAVDQLDDVEDVRAVALAVHHQQVRERERRVAQDVRPDLRQLGLRPAWSARSARRGRANSSAARSPDASPTPPTMHGSVPISSMKRSAAMRSGTWATKRSSPTLKPRCFSR